jgi:hypothetical protein
MAPEFESIEAFAELLYEEEREVYTFEELMQLTTAAKVSAKRAIAELAEYGLRYAGRPHEKNVRGFTTKNDRWTACPSHGGSGYEQIAGFAGNAAR